MLINYYLAANISKMVLKTNYPNVVLPVSCTSRWRRRTTRRDLPSRRPKSRWRIDRTLNWLSKSLNKNWSRSYQWFKSQKFWHNVITHFNTQMPSCHFAIQNLISDFVLPINRSQPFHYLTHRGCYFKSLQLQNSRWSILNIPEYFSSHEQMTYQT